MTLSIDVVVGRGTFGCAPAAIGHATDAPPSSVMNSRRFN
jgi:hypothetical protein